MEETNYNYENTNPSGFDNHNASGAYPVPNATAVLVLGILSIVLCVCYGIVGLILGIIALVLSGKAKALYQENPSAYTLSSFNNLKAGRVCAIIGTCLSAAYFLFVILYLVFVGTMLSTIPWQDLQH